MTTEPDAGSSAEGRYAGRALMMSDVVAEYLGLELDREQQDQLDALLHDHLVGAINPLRRAHTATSMHELARILGQPGEPAQMWAEHEHVHLVTWLDETSDAGHCVARGGWTAEQRFVPGGLMSSDEVVAAHRAGKVVVVTCGFTGEPGHVWEEGGQPSDEMVDALDSLPSPLMLRAKIADHDDHRARMERVADGYPRQRPA